MSMDSIKEKFKKISLNNSHWSSWSCFCETLNIARLKNEKQIRKHFNQLVKKDDWKGSSKKELLDYLLSPEFQGSRS